MQNAWAGPAAGPTGLVSRRITVTRTARDLITSDGLSDSKAKSATEKLFRRSIN
uniref:Uncharacterized protein n=1 Tax=Arundo donax TaxID=35708 RepID=A0A0A9CNB4_ARUDO